MYGVFPYDGRVRQTVYDNRLFVIKNLLLLRERGTTKENVVLIIIGTCSNVAR